MVKLLKSANPDDGSIVPVVIDETGDSLKVTSLALSRADSEGNPRAFHAEVVFDTTEGHFARGFDYDLVVSVHVLTEGHVAPMTETFYNFSRSDGGQSQSMSTNSGGDGAIHAILVKNSLVESDS